MGPGRFVRIVPLSKCVLNRAADRQTYSPHAASQSPARTQLGGGGLHRSMFLFSLPLSTHLSLSIAAVSTSLLTFPAAPKYTFSPLYLPTSHSPSTVLSLPLFLYLSLKPPPSGSPLSLFFFLPVTAFPGLIAILSEGKCFVTNR